MRYGPAGRRRPRWTASTWRPTPGEVLVVLGPNGAGKTSTIESLEGYRRPAGGRISVLGLDPIADHRRADRPHGRHAAEGRRLPDARARGRSSTSSPATTPTPLATDALLDLVGLRRRRHHAVAPSLRRRATTALAGPGPHRPARRWPSSTSRRPASTPKAAWPSGPWWPTCAPRGCACCSPPTSWPKPRRWPTASSSSPRAGSSSTGTPPELTAASGHRPVSPSARRPGWTRPRWLANSAPGRHGAPRRAPGRYRIEGASGPAATAALATWLAARDATLTDLVTGRTLEDVYFEAVGAGGPAATESEHRRPDDGAEDGAPGRGRATASRRRASPGPTMRALLAQTRAEVFMTLRRGRDPALDRRYPGPLPRLLLHRRRGVDAAARVGRLLRARASWPWP